MELHNCLRELPNASENSETFGTGCRLCAKNNREQIPLSVDSSIYEKITRCLGINASINDKLPQNVCVYCLKLLDMLYMYGDVEEVDDTLRNILQMFHKQCREVDVMFRSCLSKSMLEQKENDDKLEHENENYKMKVEKESNTNIDTFELGHVKQSCEKEKDFYKVSGEGASDKNMPSETIIIKKEITEETTEMKINYEKILESVKNEPDKEFCMPFAIPVKVELIEESEATFKDNYEETSYQSLEYGNEDSTTLKCNQQKNDSKENFNNEATTFSDSSDCHSMSTSKLCQTSIDVKRFRWEYLEKFYENVQFPTPSDYTELQEDLCVTRGYLRKWFNRKRKQCRNKGVEICQTDIWNKSDKMSNRTEETEQENSFTSEESSLIDICRFSKEEPPVVVDSAESDSEISPEALQRKRKAIRKDRFAYLEEIYKANPSPGFAVYDELEKQLGVSRKYLSNWFSRRRIKESTETGRANFASETVEICMVKEETRMENNNLVFQKSSLIDTSSISKEQQAIFLGTGDPSIMDSKDFLGKLGPTFADLPKTDSQVSTKSSLQRKRKAARINRFAYLENIYKTHTSPTSEIYRDLHEKLGVSLKYLQNWFWTRRAKDKKEPAWMMNNTNDMNEIDIKEEICEEENSSIPSTSSVDATPLLHEGDTGCSDASVIDLQAKTKLYFQSKTLNMEKIAYLENLYETNTTPTDEIYKELQERFGVSRKYVRDWFWKRKFKGKRGVRTYNHLDSDVEIFLEQFFQTNPFPSSEQYIELQVKLGLPKRALWDWFGSRRRIGRRMNEFTAMSVPVEKKRITMDSTTKAYLQEYFQKYSNPSSQQYTELQEKLGLPRGYLYNWFTYMRKIANRDARRNFPCFVCKKKFLSLHTLYVHMSIHSSDNGYVCRVCGKIFAVHSYLTQHMLYHSNEESYKCDICGKGFVHRSGIYSHIQSQHM